MSTRRRARAGVDAVTDPQAFPDELRAGPCVEVWEARGRAKGWQSGYVIVSPRWDRAQRARTAWRTAVHEWAELTGWATERRPADNACNLARTRHPWSRDYLLGVEGGRALVDYFEGRRDTWPEDAAEGWAAHY